jgi:hypothetical protein
VQLNDLAAIGLRDCLHHPQIDANSILGHARLKKGSVRTIDVEQRNVSLLHLLQRYGPKAYGSIQDNHYVVAAVLQRQRQFGMICSVGVSASIGVIGTHST